VNKPEAFRLVLAELRGRVDAIEASCKANCDDARDLIDKALAASEPKPARVQTRAAATRPRRRPKIEETGKRGKAKYEAIVELLEHDPPLSLSEIGRRTKSGRKLVTRIRNERAPVPKSSPTVERKLYAVDDHDEAQSQ
jgi:hypothetical protein